MTKLSLAAFIITGITSVSVLAAGSNNTIRFQGEVADQTCAVAVNGNVAQPVILLPTAKTSDLASIGSFTEATSFTVSVSGCTTSAVDDLNIGTVFLANNITTTNNIGNTETDNGVSLQLIDPSLASGSQILDVTGTIANPGLVVLSGESAASYDYAVRYVAETASVTPGKVSGSVQYAISYN